MHVNTYLVARMLGVFSCVVLFALLPQANARWAREQLHRDLFSNRENVRPAGENETVWVDVSFGLKQILSLDGKNQVLETTGRIVMIWFDPSLAWNTSEYEGVSYTEVSANNVWTPLIGLRNSADELFDSNWKDVYPVFIFSPGLIYWVVEGKFQSSCNLDMRMFPFDTQYCSLNIGNLVHVDVTVNLSMSFDHIDQEFYLSSKEFDIVKTWVEPTLQRHTSFEYFALPVLKFWLELERRPAYYLINVIVPTIALAFLSTFSFLVPVDAGEKLSLAITILLSFIVFLLILSDNTPRSSEPLPILAVYLTTVICLTGFSLIIQILILRMYHKYPEKPLPVWMQSLTSILYFGCLRPRPEAKEDNESCHSVGFNLEDSKRHKDDWRLAAEALDKFFFTLFMCVHISLMVMLSFVTS